MYNAIGFLFEEDDFTELLINSKVVFLIVLTDKDAEHCLAVEEIQRAKEFCSGLPENCDFVWAIHHRPGLGNAVQTVVIIGI